MTDQIEDGPEPQDEPVAAPVAETPDAPVERQIDPETVALAERYGWRPKDRSTLPEGSWMDAERFVAASKTQVRILNDKLGETGKRVEAAEALARTAAETVRFQERQRYEQHLQSLRAAQRQAAEQGDVQRYDQLTEMEGRMRPPEPVTQPSVAMPDWANDVELRNVGAALIDATPGIKAMPPERQIEWAEKRVRALYPDKFPAAAPPVPRDESGRYTTSKVDGGGLATGASPASHGLSAEESADVKRLIARGVFKNVGEYVKYSKELGVRE
jgi:hypothetical protein